MNAAASTGAPSALAARLSANRRWVVAILLAAVLAAMVSIAIFRQGALNNGTGTAGRNIGSQLGNGAKALSNSVASLFGLRSPGERATGTLANLKHKRQPVLHERALPKVQRRALRPLAAPTPPDASPEALPANPLYNIVGGAPEGGPATIATEAPPLGLLPGGPGIIIGPPGSPGLPVIPVTPGTPSTPGGSGVPEPASWAMMLVGFVLMGWHLGHARRAALRGAAN